MFRRFALLFIVAALAVAVTAAAELPTRKVLTLEAAKEIAAAADRYAKENGWLVNIAIVDEGANLLYFQRNLGVQIGSIEVALKKADCAAKFRRSTKVFADMVGQRPGVVSLPGVLAVEGGLPITWEGEMIGAIGVSGVTSEQDGMIAQAGLDALAKFLGAAPE
jgi:glc operon protein GlcG